MNPSSIILFLFFFNVFTLKAFSFTTQKIPYFDHCNSYVPEANRTYTNRIATRSPYLEPLTTQYTGGQNIFYQDPTSQCSIFFQTTGSIYATNVVDTYKVQAQLSFAQSSIYYRASKFTRIRSKYSRVVQRYRRPLVFNLDGFWSVSTNKLCMVGSARLFTQGGNLLKRNAVLKLKFPGYMTLNNSLVSGIMMSLASPNDSDYFDQISILGFPSVPAWDIVIVYGGLVFAVIVFLQQHFGGRFMFPKRFQEQVEYEVVPKNSQKHASIFVIMSSYMMMSLVIVS